MTKMKDKYADRFRPSAQDSWRGYDYDQLCYHRALTQTRIALEKHHLNVMLQGLRNPATVGSAVMQRVMGAFNYMDYAVLGVKIFKLFRKLKPRRSKAAD